MRLHLQGTLTDVFQRGGPPHESAEELHQGTEVAIDLDTGVPEMQIDAMRGRIRSLGPGVWTSGEWSDLPQLGGLVGVTVRKGFSARAQEILEGAGESRDRRSRIIGEVESGAERPQLSQQSLAATHLVFMMAPVVMQCMPSLLAELSVEPKAGQGTGTAPNSCHMWRSDGPLLRMIAAASASQED
jgi:hypothetical protein